MQQPFVIIGGDAAGMSAASKIKRELPDASVIVFERDPVISYSACGMPYWLGGVVASDQDLLALTIENARHKRKIDVRIQHEVTSIDPARQVVTVKKLSDGSTLEQAYHKLLIATGASSVRPSVPGVDLPGVFALRSLPDAQRIQHFLGDQQPQRAVIVGGGYIAVEMAEALRLRGIAVTMLVRSQLLSDFDADMVQPLIPHLAEHGVQMFAPSNLQAIEHMPAGQHPLRVLALDSNQQSLLLEADLVLLATGVRPNSDLAQAAGLRIGVEGAIWVDQTLRSSDPNIYAAGDCAQYNHVVTNEPVWIPLAPAANKSGRIAGENAAGSHTVFPGVAGTTIVKVFDYTIATTGLTEKAAKANAQFGRHGEWVGSATITYSDKAGYYPGSEEIVVKLIFDKRNGRVLGGEMVGKAGVNKRIDIVTTALSAKMTLNDVAMLDLSYAPPFSTVYDPIQVAANVGVKDVN